MNSLINSNVNRRSLRTLLLILAAAPLLLTGCSGGSNGSQTLSMGEMHGSVYGGQQPIQQANIYLYAAGTTGYASANINLLTSSVQTGTNGTFTLPSPPAGYTCVSGQQMYIVAVGGNPGSGTNANETTVAALGDCSMLTTSTNIQMNEVTTVAAAYALAQFATGYANIGTDAGNVAGLKRAFVNAAKLASYSTGTANGALPSGATAPTSEIYSLANSLAACVNSTGGVATTPTTACGKLFNYTTPASTLIAPTDVFGAALNIAKYPTTNVSNLYALGVPSPPFASGLGSAPSDWTVSIVYAGGSFNSPKTTTVDANGQIWVANSGNNTVSVLAQTGTPIGASPLSSNSLSSPSAIAIDNSGNAWVADTGSSKVSAFTNAGGVFGSSPFTVGSAPNSLAFDASGNVWVGNSTGNSVTELNSSGTLVQTITGLTSPSAIVIDPK